MYCNTNRADVQPVKAFSHDAPRTPYRRLAVLLCSFGCLRFTPFLAIWLLGAFCGGIFAQSCVFQTNNGQPYFVSWKFQPQFGTGQGKPLKVVALGDSVVWGDGDMPQSDKDKPQHKIVGLFSQNLADDTSRGVELHSYAHSGARLQYAPDADSMLPALDGSPVSDVDAERPTTNEQADCAAIGDTDADYVLMDGCINEIGASNIALPPTLGLNRTTPQDIRALAFYYCAVPMRNTLEKVMKHFPRAKIVLLNYFLVVSAKSKPEFDYTKSTGVQQTSAHNEQQIEVKQALTQAIQLEGRITSKTDIDAEANRAMRVWADNSEEFLADSESCFQWAIDSASAGGQEPADPEPPDSVGAVKGVCKPFPGAAPSGASQQSFLAKVSDDPNFSYGTRESHLWLLPDPLIHPDELFGVRSSECDRTHYLNRKDTSCKINPIAHPNKLGAQCYAKSMLSALGMQWTPPTDEPTADCPNP